MNSIFNTWNSNQWGQISYKHNETLKQITSEERTCVFDERQFVLINSNYRCQVDV